MLAVLLAILVAPLNSQTTPAPATLILRAVDADTGGAVVLTAAELYVDVWGGDEPVKLSVRGDEVSVQLGRDQLCVWAPVWCRDQSVTGRITVRADGYAAIASDLFPWIGSHEQGAQFGIALDHPTTVRFPGNGARRVRPGAVQSLTLRFRRPLARELRVVDTAGRPIPDASVTVTETHARSNHCGVPEGPRRFEGRTTVDGIVKLPGDDVEWTVSVGKQHHQFVPRRVGPGKCVTDIQGRLPAGTTTAVLRRLHRRPLDLQFRNRDGSPAVVEVNAMPGACDCCGACSGPLGKTDAEGRFVKTDFYPDEWSEIFVNGATPGERRWSIDPRRERWTGTKRVVFE